MGKRKIIEERHKIRLTPLPRKPIGHHANSTSFKKGYVSRWNHYTKEQKMDSFIKKEQFAIERGMPEVDYRQLGGKKFMARPICIYCGKKIKPALVVYEDGTIGVECGNPDCPKEMYGEKLTFSSPILKGGVSEGAS